ncbi:glycerate kinase [Sinomonas cyclohexanicum]|uniref:Glycerate kinase n=1 Tax=Sinomonas cyclohexanicum TaxID=322009 RepID=A0ABN6FL90_SINCY|nr:glycerate kinase [Corynebacterium cyclohexanicum]BCT77533.1 glycerate kinase [Corynebacterium cyclohexanicum]
MKIVLAPDKFKGSLTAAEVAEALAAGIREVLPEAELVQVPVADGGEGTVSAALGAGFSPRRAAVAGPTGQRLTAEFAVSADADGNRTAVIEMAAASGLDVLPGGTLDARGATSLGTGQLIRAALDAGCREIVLGVGGSACTDGGAGMLAGLGARFTDDAGRDLPLGGAALARIASADLSGLDTRLDHASGSFQLTLAADVDNPLLGVRGAAAVFGPQKGASPSDVTELDAALARFAAVLGAEMGPWAAAAKDLPGAGAAGGVGYAALALGARRRRGIDVVVEFTRLREKLAGAELVVTGEGSLDAQSLSGKAPVGVAAEAAALGIPAVAVCGRSQLDPASRAAAGFRSVHALTDLEPDVDTCIREAASLLRQVGRDLAATIVDSNSRKESVR